MTATKSKGKVIGYEPQPMQQVAHSCPADEILYGGAAGGGKSDWLINEQIFTSIAIPGTTNIIFRRTSPELQELRDRAEDLLAPVKADGEVSYNHNNDRWMFKNGSKLRFSHLQYYENVRQHQSFEYDTIAFDEGTHFTGPMVEYLKSRNRSTVPGSRPRLLIASNPGSVGHVYVKDYFVEPKQDGYLIEEADLIARFDWKRNAWVRFPAGHRGKPAPYVVWRPDPSPEMERANEDRAAKGLDPLPIPTRCFIPAKLFDNKYLAEDGRYEARLRSMDEKEQKALLEGSWDIFEGQYFAGFTVEQHVVDPISPPVSWSKWAGMDWGHAKPLAYLWATQDPETDQIIVYRELYQPMLNDPKACELILDMGGDEPDYTMADPSMWRGDSNEQSITRADNYAKHGVLLQPAVNDRIAGWSRVKELLAINPKTGKPGLVITRNCTNLIRTLPQLVHDENNPEDLDTDGEDHAVDALRYLTMSRRSFTNAHRGRPKAQKWRR